LSRKLVRQRRDVRRHEVGGLDRAQAHHVLVGPAVAHHPDRPHRQEHRERLRGLLVPPGGAQLVDEDGVGAAQEVGVLPFHLAEDPHAQPRSRERMPEDHLARQAEREAELPHCERTTTLIQPPRSRLVDSRGI